MYVDLIILSHNRKLQMVPVLRAYIHHVCFFEAYVKPYPRLLW